MNSCLNPTVHRTSHRNIRAPHPSNTLSLRLLFVYAFVYFFLLSQVFFFSLFLIFPSSVLALVAALCRKGGHLGSRGCRNHVRLGPENSGESVPAIDGWKLSFAPIPRPRQLQ